MSATEILEELPGLSHQDRVRIFDLLRILNRQPASGLPSEEVKAELDDVFAQCNEAGWDGYGALPVVSETYENALRLLAKLGAAAPPEISAEPDGEISLEWSAKSGRVFSVSVGPDNRLAFAGLDGTGEWHGVETFTGEAPELIRRGIEIATAA